MQRSGAASTEELDRALGEAESSQAAVLLAQAELRGAELELSFTTIHAPISGMVSDRELLEVVTTTPSLDEACRTLIGRANLAGGLNDNRLTYSGGLLHLNVMSGIDGDDRARSTGEPDASDGEARHCRGSGCLGRGGPDSM